MLLVKLNNKPKNLKEKSLRVDFNYLAICCVVPLGNL